MSERFIFMPSVGFCLALGALMLSYIRRPQSVQTVLGITLVLAGLFSAMREVLRKIYQVNTELNYFIGKLRDFLLVIVSVVLFLTTMAITSAVQVVEIYSQGIFGEYLTLTLFQKIVPVVRVCLSREWEIVFQKEVTMNL